MGYLGNKNCHWHFGSLLKDGKNFNIGDVFSDTKITQKEWWMVRDLFIQAYALKAAAGVYRHGGHQTHLPGTTDVIKSAFMEDNLNKDLKIVLDEVWIYLCNIINKEYKMSLSRWGEDDVRASGFDAPTKKYDFTELSKAFESIAGGAKPGTIHSFASKINGGKNVYKPENKSPLLFRYIRKHHDDFSIQGNGGLAVGFIINYDRHIVEVYPSICKDNETFCKSIGREIIKDRVDREVGFTMPYYPLHKGLIDQLMEHDLVVAPLSGALKDINNLLKTMNTFFKQNYW